MKAHEFLEAGIGHMKDRAAAYDAPSGERSMEKTVAIFNELLAEKLRSPLTEEDGWNFMEILKLVRSKQGKFKADSYEDRAAYAGLAGEAAFNARDLDCHRRGWRGAVVGVRFDDGPDCYGWDEYDGFSSYDEMLEMVNFNKGQFIFIEIDGVVVHDSFVSKKGDLEKVLYEIKHGGVAGAIHISIKEKDSPCYRCEFDFLSYMVAARTIERLIEARNTDLIIGADDGLLYVHATAKNGDLEKLLERLKCQA